MSLLQGVEKIIPPNAFQISSAEVIQNSHSFSEMDEIERRIESAPEPQIFQWYMRFQMWKPGPLLIVLWWFCIILVGVFYGFKLLGLTVFSFSAPPGTEGHTADVMMSKEFGDKADSRQLLIYYHCDECGNATGRSLPPIQWTPNKTFTPLHNQSYEGWTLNRMSHELVSWCNQYPDVFQGYTDFYDTFFSYGLIKDTGLPENDILARLAHKIFVTEGNDSAIGIVTYDNTADQTEKNEFIDDLTDQCTHIANRYGRGKIKMSMTGETALIMAMNAESRKDVEKKDTLTIPIALCVLALIVRSWRLMFIPLLTFGTSICAAFSLMRPVEYIHWPIAGPLYSINLLISAIWSIVHLFASPFGCHRVSLWNIYFDAKSHAFCGVTD